MANAEDWGHDEEPAQYNFESSLDISGDGKFADGESTNIVCTSRRSAKHRRTEIRGSSNGDVANKSKHQPSFVPS